MNSSPNIEHNKASSCMELDRTGQFSLFDGPSPQQPVTVKAATQRTFRSPSPETLSYGGLRLDKFLRQSGLIAPLIVRELLEQQDWSSFESKYSSTGRAPYAPMNMLGLILYGIMQGVSSLRGLEQMARSDLGSHWVTGAIFPDHASLGRFIVLHDEVFSGDYFESLTRLILTKTNSTSDCVAGDGTVIEAACSHYNLLKEEAVKQALAAAQKAAIASPNDEGKQTQLAHAENVSEQFTQRKESRESRKQKTDKLCISGTEPDAMVQPLKRNRGSGPSYKPSVAANEQRIILGYAVDPSSELIVLPEMLDQAMRILGREANELLLDAGYFARAPLAEAVKRGISLLCPERSTKGVNNADKSLFRKDVFIYNEIEDSYRCPAGENLLSEHQRRSDKQPEHIRYRTSACQGCPLKSKCTKSERGRVITRYKGDEEKDALRIVMEQPKAKEIYSKRQGMVEPVFSHMRGKQGLNKFRRRNIEGARREFSLHVLAYNLSRAVALWPSYTLVLSLYLMTLMKTEKSPINIRFEKRLIN